MASVLQILANILIVYFCPINALQKNCLIPGELGGFLEQSFACFHVSQTLCRISRTAMASDKGPAPSYVAIKENGKS